jgi:hypothetical protein
MAHFAKLDANNTVLEVHVVNNAELMEAGVEREEKGIAFLTQWSGGYPYWKQTSYNRKFRKNFAGAGHTYDAIRDVFIPPKPFNSWVLDEDTCLWNAPVAMPEDAGTGEPPKRYQWDEVTINWKAIEE